MCKKYIVDTNDHINYVINLNKRSYLDNQITYNLYQAKTSVILELLSENHLLNFKRVIFIRQIKLKEVFACNLPRVLEHHPCVTAM